MAPYPAIMLMSRSRMATFKLMRLTKMMAMRMMNISAQANWWKVSATDKTGEAKRKISRTVRPDQYAITVVIQTKDSAVLRFGWLRTRMKGMRKRTNGAIKVLGRESEMGWNDSRRAIASSRATLVNSDGCKLNPPGKAIQRSTELALKMMM